MQKKRTCHARLHPILTFSSRYQTGWNVTKCHACHAKRHDNLHGNIRKGGVLAASHIDTTTPQENETHRQDTWMQKKERSVRDFLQLCHLQTHYQTGWNVKKCHVCHTKQHDNLLGNIRKGEVFQLPLWTRRRHRNTSAARQDTWIQKN